MTKDKLKRINQRGIEVTELMVEEIEIKDIHAYPCQERSLTSRYTGQSHHSHDRHTMAYHQ